jgi:hypothetical protein
MSHATRRENPSSNQERTVATSWKDKAEEAGDKVSEAATKVGHKVSEKVEEATDWAKERAHQAGHRMQEAAEKVAHRTGASITSASGAAGAAFGIKEHMDVVASCGTMVGKVDHVQGDTIKLTKNDSPDGRHHQIPLGWVAKVDSQVHLDRDHREVQAEWRPA